MNTHEFDAIRPYLDGEVPAVIQELIQEHEFIGALQVVFPDLSIADIQAKLKKIQSVYDFQAGVIAGVVKFIADHSIRKLECLGLENLSSGSPHLIISNHRDIVLDSALLNYTLFKNNLDTTRIAIGNNLLQKNWIEKLVRLNKNFIVHRDVQARQAYSYSMRISRYIRKSITDDKQSVWIAQREGRTKDGKDNTQSGLLKMIGMSGGSDDVGAFDDLHILPLSISYELEPCAGLKAREMYIRNKTGQYQKQPGEDLQSMKSGMMDPKGCVCLHFGASIRRETLEDCFRDKSRNEGLRELAAWIDKQIHSRFQLYPFHYCAADILSQTSRYSAFYSKSDYEDFNRYAAGVLAPWPEDAKDMMPFLLQIYANPVYTRP